MKIIVRFRIIERLARKASYEASKRLEANLIELYTSIWRYLLKAYRYFGRNTASRCYHAQTLQDRISTKYHAQLISSL